MTTETVGARTAETPGVGGATEQETFVASRTWGEELVPDYGEQRED